MNVYAPIILCFVPFITMFLLFAILVPGISVLHEFIASLAGLVAFIPIVLLQFLIPELRLFHQVKVISILLYSILFCGLIEEGVKAGALLILHVKGETLRNYFLYSLLAGMILGCFESVVYLLQLVQSGNPKFLPAKLIHLRMGTALVVHTLCAGLGGLCVFYCKNVRRNFLPLVYAVLIHGVYDFFAAFSSSLNYFSIAVILLAVLECRIIYVRIGEEISAARFGNQKISDPNKTLEMPKNPALVISVKNTENKKEENDMFFDRWKKKESDDFDAIQKEAEAAVKKSEEKKAVAVKTAAEKTAVAKTTVAKKSAAAKSTEAKKVDATKKAANAKKTAAKKTVAKKASAAKSKSSTAKKAAAKKATTAKKSAVKKTAAAKKSATQKKTAVKKAATKKVATAKKTAAKKVAAKKTAVKKTTATKKAVAKKTASKKK